MGLAAGWAVVHLMSARPPQAEPQRVLMLATREWPVLQQVRALLKAGGTGEPALPPMEADFVEVKNGSNAREVLQRMKPQLGRYRAIFTPSQTFARAAQIEAPDIPIIFDGVNNPVLMCLVDSFTRPGRNATGYMHYLSRSEEKMLQTLHDAFPALREVLVLRSGDLTGPQSCSPDDSTWTRPLDEDCVTGPRPVTDSGLNTMAAHLGVRLHHFVICRRADFEALVAAAQAPQLGLLVPWHTLFDDHRAALLDTIARTQRPAIYPSHRYSREGGLMSLEVLTDQAGDRSSVLALLQVLHGRRPAELPVQSPRGFTLTVNALTAQRSGLHPSLAVLRRAEDIVREAPAR